MSSKQPTKLAEAAKRLGISKQAAQQRIDRGQLDAYKDDKGHWWVMWPPDEHLVGELVVDGPEPPAVPRQADLALALSSFVDELQTMHKTLEHQQATIDRLAALVEQQQQSQPSRDQWIVQRMREMLAEKQERKPWWKRMMRR